MRVTANSLDRKEITNLRAGCERRRPPIDRANLYRAELGTFITAFQRAVGLSAEGALAPETGHQLIGELEIHLFAERDPGAEADRRYLDSRVTQSPIFHPPPPCWYSHHAG